MDAFADSRQFAVMPDGAVVDRSPDTPVDATRDFAQVQLKLAVSQIVQQATDTDDILATAMGAAINATVSDYGATSLAEADQNVQNRPSLAQILRDYQVSPDPRGITDYPRDPMVRYLAELLGKTKAFQVTVTEAEMLEKMSLTSQQQFLQMREYAFAEADKRFPDHGQEDNHNDAFRHAYWNALMVGVRGAEWAQRFATAHEALPGNPKEREAMDLYNNEVGRKIALANPGTDPERLAGLVEDAVRKGDTVVIARSGDLEFSDRVPAGAIGAPSPGPDEPVVQAEKPVVPNPPKPGIGSATDWW
ncbi:DUF6973 domain-containing protein [Nocardia suismassiliense]|uniref:DUF6973 domain-containing protein n=1 Tax=Nocardia suismassiliense TaxID=2077092 RepID=UPI00131F23C4|nr:hypothetical protein [Nocardia suismassiliense]